ncbi:MAG: Stk1 family PASTA domain-containing Ser/Thr kinase [Firmicutes bacterium]|nr:Stk1 family PASTA domain-containing Ser/Thr kinase [Bacillota bacterium]
MIGTRLANRYEIKEQLGEGGMAVVYRAVDLVLHRPVAIKALRSNFAGDPEFLQRFLHEAQAAASLSHPNVVNIFDVGQADGVHYIVLEYVQGRNLKEILRDERRLPPRRAAVIARAVARALEAAHRRQLIHRDIKPHNILITPEGRVKVTDFGIARAASVASLTQTGTVMGSVHYFSPEQARGEAVGPESDLYSLGVVLYEMLTGTVPFRGESPIAVALKHLEQNPVPPSKHNPDIPPWLERVVLKALAKDPARRYRSAEEMAKDLIWRDDPPVDPDEDALFKAGAEPPGVDRLEATRRVPKPVPRGIVLDAEAAADEGESAGEDDGVQGRKRRPRVLAAVFLALFALGAAAYAGAPFILRLIFPPEVTVPDVTGLSYADARRVLADSGLMIVIESERHDRQVPAGLISRQNPEAGRVVRQGRTVYVTISRGPELGIVPDVTGRPVREARLILTQEGYVLGEELAEFRPGIGVNVVWRQEPAPGTEVEKGTPVSLWVNRPTEALSSVTVPDFRGRPLAEAEEQLTELGLVLGNAWPEINPLLPPGRVIDQNPPPSTPVEPGTAVDFVYSAGSGAPFEQDGATPPEAEPVPGSGDREPGSSGPGLPAASPTGEQGPLPDSGRRRTARVDIYVPPGPPQEVVILVIDDFGLREVYRETVPGGTSFRQYVEGRGDGARVQVYIGGMMEVDEPFPD